MRQIFFICMLFVFSLGGNIVSASTLTYWTANPYGAPGGYQPTKHADHTSACMALIGTPSKNWYWSNLIVESNTTKYDCYRAYTAVYCPKCGNQYRGFAGLIQAACPYGHKDFKCNATPPACEYGSFYSQSNQCVAGADKGQPPQVCSVSSTGSSSSETAQLVGNPINFLTGNKFHQEIHFTASDAGGLRFLQTYNSADAVWRHSYSDKLVFHTDHVLVSLSDGKDLRYSLAGSPLDSAAERIGVLKASGNGWTFVTKEQLTYFFDSQGRLDRLTLRNGQSHQLSYAASGTTTLVSVSDNFGKSISIKQNVAGQLLEFDAPGINIFVGYVNSTIGTIRKTVNGSQLVREYHYEDSRNRLLLTGVTDERGRRYATWRYDDYGRAISSEHDGGVDKVLISYDNNLSTTVTNELGKNTIYRFAVINGSKRIIAIEGQPSANCPNSNSNFTYDESGLLKTKNDNKGHLTTHDYNNRGLEISRTEASGTSHARTITTEWHPTLFLPVTVTEPTRITTYTYDAQGRQLSQSVTQR